MKTKLFCVVSLLLSGMVFYLLNGQSFSTDPGFFSGNMKKNASLIYSIDPATWKIIGPESESDLIALLNSPDKLEQRRMSALMLVNPREYARLFPKSSKELRGETAARESLMMPNSLDKGMASWRNEELVTHVLELEMLRINSYNTIFPVPLADPLKMGHSKP